MKVSPRIHLVVSAIVIALAIVGCGHKQEEGHAHEPGKAGHEHETEVGVTFNAKKGLRVPPETAKFLGLQTAEVQERKVAATLQFSAQVYRAAGEAQLASLQPGSRPSALASGNVSAADAAKLSAGQTVSVLNVDGLAMSGRILSVKHDMGATSGQIEVLLTISDGQRPLVSGSFVNVTVSLGGEKLVASVPSRALFRTTEGDFVYTVSGEHFVRAQVKLGAVGNEFTEVADGLYAGDQIVVQPVMTLWLAELQSLRGGESCADGH